MVRVNKKKEPSIEIINGLGAGLSLIDRKMRIVWANSFQQEWFGKNEKILGRHCHEVYQHRNKICPDCPTKKVFLTGKIETCNQPGITINGEKKNYFLTVVPIKNGNNKTVQVLELVQDVTKAKNETAERIRLIRRLKYICSRLIKTNNKLQKDVCAIKEGANKIKKLNSKLEKRYKYLAEELNLTKHQMKDIFEVTQSISSCANLKNTLLLIIRFARQLIHADAAALRMVSKDNKILVSEVSVGLSKNYLLETPLKVGEGVAGKVAQIGKPLAVYNLAKDAQAKYGQIATKEGMLSALSVPAIFKDNVLGVITVYSKTTRHFSENEIKLLMTFSAQAAVAIQEAKLYHDVHLNYFNTIHALILAMEAKDPYTRGHSERVTQYSIKIATKLGIPREQIDILQFAGRVHDVGKIGISDLILNKPGKLTLAERAIIELHPVKGAEMLEPLGFLEQGLPLVRHHHERFDGNGYPDRLTKTEIPLCARILACADAFDAMTSERPYKIRKLTLEEAVDELKNNSGRQFDPQVVPAFIQILQEES